MKRNWLLRIGPTLIFPTASSDSTSQGKWQVGFANWEAVSARDVWTVPLGIGIGKAVKVGPLPVKLALGVQYMVHHPDVGGQKWTIQLMFVPVIPKLIKGNLRRRW